MSTRQKDEKSIFKTALELKTPAERAAYVEKICADDPALRARIFALLEAHEDKGDFLEALLDEPVVSVDDQELKEKPGTVIGRYKLLEKIGEGGMAVVYMAEQEKPIRRKVALKIIKLGMETKSVIARFEAERQALAIMDHPNIAKVLDAGATETGRPYFVMDLVPGVCITEYCDNNRLSIKERLSLFISVCSAVQHAHQKGIIHRDIKPSNIMVTLHDGKPVPKVIDFGIAKATNQRLTEKTLFTRYAHIIGTPAYMSPEQAELSDLDVDTRADIYSLGVLLYELLTGTTPFSEEELRKAGFLQMQKIICEEEPTKPSTKLSTLGKALTDIAKLHNSSPELMPKLIRGDLDWIVMKSLEKERTHRYDTASALVMDVRRHLDNEPVSARPHGLAYVFGKYMRRHKFKIATAGTMTVLLSVVVIVSLMWNDNRVRLMRVASFADSGILSQAREAFAKNDLVMALDGVRTILNSKHVGSEARLLYAGILVEGRQPDEAVIMLEKLLNERPEVAGAAHSLLARILWEDTSADAKKLRDVDEHLKRAEDLLPETAEAYFLRAMTAMTIKEKSKLLDRALRLNPGHYESRRLRAYTYHCSRNFSGAAEDALCLVMLRPEDPLGHALRAGAFRELDRCDEAINSYNKAIEYTSSEDPQLVDLYDHRRETYIQMGRYQEALLDAKKCISLAKEEEIYHIHVFTSLISLGLYEEAKAKYSELYDSLPEQNTTFWAQCAKYVVDTLEANPQLNLPKTGALEPAFLPMLETEKIYRDFKTKSKRLITDGQSPSWSHDGTKLAYTKGVHGASGIAVYDLRSQQTELLFVPGKDPVYSPDGRHIAFVRDRQILPLGRLTTNREHQYQPEERDELWLMKVDGSKPRRLARGQRPHWSPDSKFLFYHSVSEQMLYSIPVNDDAAEPTPVFSWSTFPPTLSPDNEYVAYAQGNLLTILELSSREIVAQWISPMGIEVKSWAPNGPQLHIPAFDHRIGVGLWIYDFEQNDVTEILTAPVSKASWSPDKKKLAVSLGSPFYDIWIVDTDSLSPGQTLKEYLRERAEFYDRVAQADPCNADRHLFEAAYYQYLADPNSSLSGQKRYADLFFGEPGDYGHPVNLGPIVNSSGFDGNPSISFDGLELFFASNRPSASGNRDIWVTRRESTEDQWGKPTNLGPTVNSQALDEGPCISQDGLTLYFASNRPGGHGRHDLWLTTRPMISAPWGEPENLGPIVNSLVKERHPHISADGLSLYFSGGGLYNRPKGYVGADIWIATRASLSDEWNVPVNLGPQINTSFYDAGPFVTSDGLYLFFHSGRSGNRDIWVSRRKNTSAPFGKPKMIAPPVWSPFRESSACLSADGSTLYFYSLRPAGSGGPDLWQAPILHWPDDIEAPDGTDPVEMLPETDEGKEVVPEANH